MTMLQVKLLSFNDYDNVPPADEFIPCKERKYIVQMFGTTSTGESVSVTATEFTPYFYVLVSDDWKTRHKQNLIDELYRRVSSKYFADSIINATMVKRKKLYGFNGGKQFKFVRLDFSNQQAMRKFRNLWFSYEKNGSEHVKKLATVECCGCNTELYEGQIPPLLRLFHAKNIKPSGWILLPLKHCMMIEGVDKGATTCHYEITIDYKRIISDTDKETSVPYSIASFDIEASSSHGDFPLAKKNYKKLAQDTVDVWEEVEESMRTNNYLDNIVNTAFGYAYEPVYNVNRVYPKHEPTEKMIECILKKIHKQVIIYEPIDDDDATCESDEEILVENEGSALGSAEETTSIKNKKTIKSGVTIEELLNSTTIERETKINTLTHELTKMFPPLKGDEVTFIGTTFWKYGEPEPYLNHCVVVGKCNDLKQVKKSVIDSYVSEKDAMLAWTHLIRKEDPDIVIGYNIFGFDYPFMYTRTKELGITQEFLKLSRNNNEVCWKTDWKTGETNIEENTIVIASGQHDLKFIKMNGRVNIDMYNFFRRDYNLSSYKLDYVSRYFIGDVVKSLEYVDGNTKIFSKNLTGLEIGSYISFDEESHTVDSYKDGAKFNVINIDNDKGIFWIAGVETPDMKKQVRWGLSKDDVTPQDIFRMTNEGPDERYLIAKYCIQDCNLVHYLMNKIDVLTGFVEMSGLCSVPMDFLVMRGQGIKLTSYIAKKCRENGTLMPDLDKSKSDDGYEGAIVLPPKRDLYLDDPVACVDYSSLYPSSMISENISHDSKVWTKEFNQDNMLIETTGEQDDEGNYIYDNLDGYKYIDITYDTYKWRRKNNNASSAMEKVKVGYKTCRYAQFPEGELGILPAILKECLAARKATRKMIKTEKDDFMKNILDKRQLSIKVTANSIYGQTGAKTSTFYEKDVAASTTATGRKLLIYGQKVIETAYKNRTIVTKVYGEVVTDAEYVYGDTDSIFFKFNLRDKTGSPIKGQTALAITIELAKQAGELASKFLKSPHDLEYEKTFLPFCLLSKKRYVGMLYEDDPTKCKRKSMGIVLNRRDNAPIVKDIYGGIIDILMNVKNIEKAAEFLQDNMKKLIAGEVPLDKLVITKSLRGNYKNPKQIAHKVLAERIGRRDPGNKPSVGDRIPFAYVKNENRKALQGDKIELPNYIVEQKLEIDYSHYITNQIMKPCQQVFALVLEKMKAFKRIKGATLRQWHKQMADLKKKHPEEEVYEARLDTLRNKEVKALLFDDYLIRMANKGNGNATVADYFQIA
jgi:DNA polymerase elongation subunit (family B)